eukprot:8286086-Ditylum_brightwellii.AAC.1
MNKVVKCKPADMTGGKFDLVEALLKGDALTHWMEFKCVETMRVSKRPDGTDKPTKRICADIFTVCLQELKTLLPKEFGLAPESLSMQSCQKTK